jgi:prevent-host-death family protein
MRIAPLADVKTRLSAYLDECKTDGPVVITRNGKAVAVLLAPVDDNDLESLLLARSPRFQALLDKSRQSLQAGKGLSRKGFWQAVAERQKKASQVRRPSPKNAA